MNTMRETTRYTWMDTPAGRLLLAGTSQGLTLIGFPDSKHSHQPEPEWQHDPGAFTEAMRQLRAYFDGTLRDFTLPLAPTGTKFQLAVWNRLREIPYGETISYGELAERVGNRSASRAVGAANGQNPLPIVVPCHRVIGGTGKLTGFGGGLHVKALLLDLERAHRNALLF